MSQYPCLDMRDAWREADEWLHYVVELADALEGESAETWKDLAPLKAQALAALTALGPLPEALREGIAREEAELATRWKAEARR